MVSSTDIDVLLFDLGGVLIDFTGFAELGPLMPHGCDRDEVRSRWIESDSVQRFERSESTPIEFAAGVIQEFRLGLAPEEFLAAFVAWARGPYPGARSLLERIPSSYCKACLSNSNELHTPLHRRSMVPLMDRFYFSDELGLVKPDREVFEYVADDLGVVPEKIVFFDDTPVNVQAARTVGMVAYEVDGVAALAAQLQRLGVVRPEPAP